MASSPAPSCAAGYAACAAEIVQPDTETEFTPGDNVQFKAHAGKDWTDALYERELPAGCGHIVLVPGFGRIAVDPENIRHAPMAEGCEELVQDAPKEQQFHQGQKVWAEHGAPGVWVKAEYVEPHNNLAGYHVVKSRDFGDFVVPLRSIRPLLEEEE